MSAALSAVAPPPTPAWVRLDRLGTEVDPLLRRLSLKAWLSEVTLCVGIGGRDQHEMVVDALFDLVRAGWAEWFGAEGRGDVPMRYRITERGRARLARLLGADGKTPAAGREADSHERRMPQPSAPGYLAGNAGTGGGS